MTNIQVGACGCMCKQGAMGAQEPSSQVDRRERWQYQFKGGNVYEQTSYETKNGVATCN